MSHRQGPGIPEEEPTHDTPPLIMETCMMATGHPQCGTHGDVASQRFRPASALNSFKTFICHILKIQLALCCRLVWGDKGLPQGSSGDERL